MHVFENYKAVGNTDVCVVHYSCSFKLYFRIGQYLFKRKSSQLGTIDLLANWVYYNQYKIRMIQKSHQPRDLGTIDPI